MLIGKDEFNMRKLVFDVGGSSIKYAIMDQEANFYERGSVDTPLDNLPHFLDTIQEVYQTYQEEVDGVAFSMPGQIDSDSGYFFSGGALLYNIGINVLEALKERIAVPISIENDGKSAALAEVWKGNLMDVEDGIVIILGTGIGGGMIKNRRLHKGKHFFAGEFSYILEPAKTLSFTNAWAMKGSTTALLMGAAKCKQKEMSEITGYDVFHWIEQKDPAILEFFDEFCMDLARQIHNFQCIYDPDRILLGGGISKQPILVETIKEKLKIIYDFIPLPLPEAELDTCKHYNDSNLIGALYNYYLHFPEE